MKKECLEVNGNRYAVNIHFEKRDNSRVSIGKRAITIRLPSFLNREERFKEILKLKSWAREKLQENPKRFRQDPPKEYKDGGILRIGDEEYMLNIDFRDKQSSSARVMGNSIHLVVSSNLSREMQNKHVSTLLSRCIARKRLPRLKEKISEMNRKHFNKEINKVFFKHNKSRWGSCSEAGNINISTRLLFAPEDVLEYVCVHELAHLAEPNHSGRFWALVEKAVPDYKEKERWLKENRDKCVF